MFTLDSLPFQEPQHRLTRLPRGLVLALILFCAGCTTTTHSGPSRRFLHLSPAILILAQQAQLARLEGKDPSILSTPMERVDRHGRLDLLVRYRGSRARAMAMLENLGAIIIAHPPQLHVIEAWIPARHVASLARLPDIVSVRYPHRAIIH